MGEALPEGEIREIVIEIDAKRLIAIVLVAVIAVGALISYIGSLASFIAPSQELPLDITTAFSADQTGNPKSTFSRGELVLINATIEMAYAYYFGDTTSYYYFTTPTKFLLLIQVMYGNTPVFMGFVVEEISPGETESAGIGYRIPDDAPTGTYKVKVMVWSNWLDEGGVPLASKSGLEFTFQVQG